MKFAFGPKVLIDPTFALTMQELKDKFQGKCKIAKEASLIASGEDTVFLNLNIGPATLVTGKGVKYPAPRIVFKPSGPGDKEAMSIRGYKPVKIEFGAKEEPEQRERTYIMIKPDGVQRGIIGEIITRFEKRGFKLIAMKFCMPGQAMFEKHYEDLAGRPFFPRLTKWAASAPVCCMCWEGTDVVKTGRKMLGATKPFDSEPGTIRGDYCIDVGCNVIHGSDSVESANKEIALWFKPEELVDWQSHRDEWIYE
jgi:nucleoside-diphosphate kinase